MTLVCYNYVGDNMIYDQFLYKYLDIKTLLLDNYKKLSINEKDVIVLVKLHEISESSRNFTMKNISYRTSFATSELESILLKLENLELVEYSVEEDAKGLQTEVYLIENAINKSLIALKQEADLNKVESSENEISLVVSILEREMKATLNRSNIDTITRWLYDDKFTITEIKAAISKASSNNSLSVNYIDRILVTNRTSKVTSSKVNGPNEKMVNNFYNLIDND